VDAALLIIPVILSILIIILTIIIILLRVSIAFILVVILTIVALDAIPKVLALIHEQMPLTEGRDTNEHRSTRVRDVKRTELVAEL
jgi:hypothetical protein